jgi:hypothetical protein
MNMQAGPALPYATPGADGRWSTRRAYRPAGEDHFGSPARPGRFDRATGCGPARAAAKQPVFVQEGRS